MGIRRIAGEMLIRPDDYLYHIPCSDNYVDVLQMPQGLGADNEFGNTVYEKDGFVPYHDHESGFETFLAWNPIDTIINGKRFLMEKGDMIQIGPGVNHGFRHLEEGSVWQELFQGIEMYGPTAFHKNMDLYHPELKEDKAFQDRIKARDYGTYLREEEPVTETVSKYEIPQLKPADRAFASYVFPGITCNLKIGRWEYGGTKEIWELVIDRGVYMEWFPFGEWNLLSVLEGKVEVTTDTGRFIAQSRDIINIHPYLGHSMTFLEDTRLMAGNVKSQLFRAMEEIKALQRRKPVPIHDWADIRLILEKHDCHLVGYHCGKGEG